MVTKRVRDMFGQNVNIGNKKQRAKRFAGGRFKRPLALYCNESPAAFSEKAAVLRNFAHFDVDNVFLVIARRAAGVAVFGARAAALFPIGANAEWAAAYFCDNVQDAHRNGGGHHEYEGHGHAENGKHKEQQAAKNLIKCIHMSKYDSNTAKSSVTPVVI